MRRRLPVAVALMLVACSPDRAAPARAAAQPVERLIQANGVRLKVVDWGGRGPALVFLHGLADNTHTFDDLAPRFIDRYHVYAFDRRGHGGSELRGPFDTETLVTDLSTLLDSLGIGPVSLVGHSLAGYELIRFATRFPARTRALVFLDAGYDYSDPVFAAGIAAYPVDMAPDQGATASPEAFSAWYHDANWLDLQWTPAMRASVAESYRILPGGRVEATFADSLTAGFLKAAQQYRPPYDSVKAPVLAIFARWPVAAMVKPDSPDSLRRRVVDWIRTYATPIQDHAIARFHAGMPAARVVVLDSTNHYVMFARPDTVLAEMRAFLNPSPTAVRQ